MRFSGTFVKILLPNFAISVHATSNAMNSQNLKSIGYPPQDSTALGMRGYEISSECCKYMRQVFRCVKKNEGQSEHYDLRIGISWQLVLVSVDFRKEAKGDGLPIE
jgi:hypothetical protein